MPSTTARIVAPPERETVHVWDIELEQSQEGRLLGHLALGQQLLEPYMDGLDAERRLALLHCVLSHHGTPDRRFGSPEALALYRLNALDASVKGALEHGLG